MHFADSLTPTNYMHRLCHRPLTVHSHKTARGTHLALALFAHSLPYLPVAASLGATGDHRPGSEKRGGAAGCVLHATPTGLDAHLRQTRGTEGKRRSLPTETSGETFMRNTLFILSLAVGLAIACTSSASAVPINAAVVKEVAATASPLQPARWRRYRRWGWWGHTKCYREFVIGPYNCHWFPL